MARAIKPCCGNSCATTDFAGRRAELSQLEAITGEAHHHLVCRRCGAVEDVDCGVGHAPCLEPAARLGYVIDEAEVTFWGLCRNCQQAPALS